LADSWFVEASRSTGTVDSTNRGRPPDGRLHASSELHAAMVNAGVWLTFAACASGIAYAGATWERPNRLLIVGIFVLGFLAGGLVALLPLDRILGSRIRDAFFITWSLFDIALIGIAVAADGGVRSAFTLLFFLPMVFAAAFYPLRTFVPVGVANVFAFAIVGDLYGDPDVSYVAFGAVSLAFAAVLCAWQAENHDRHRERLTHMSRTDPLTDCLNRRGFEEAVATTLDDALRNGRSTGLVLLDLDDFKTVNDLHGHAAGDELLCWVVDALRETVRPMDTIGRLGGDEFAVLAPDLAENDALATAERIRKKLSERIAVTTGVACFPVHGIDHDELQRHADSHLYEMKHGLANNFVAGRRELSWAATLARAVDARMAVPAEHSAAVARYAAGIAQHLGWGGADLAYLRVAAMLHDVGKVSLPDNILRKPGPLDEREYEEVKLHPVIGAEFVNRVDGLSLISLWVKHSHEHFDGSGYPDGLVGEDIPLASRILLVADAFDAMTSDRPYRGAIPHEQALEELRRNSGCQFDPRCVEAFELYVAAESPAQAASRV
jgi:diguanylate cyclase (GGDEF)-like protein/putative nucleotidyltransferase with HDIG domain